MIKDELRKARRALKTADADLKAGDGAASVNRSYYAMYYAVRIPEFPEPGYTTRGSTRS